MQFERTISLIGQDKFNKLANSKVIVFGVGGVGGFVCEALARAGVGHIDLVDNDVVSISNINRQIIALNSTVGQYKVDVMKNRINDINENCTVNTFKIFYNADTRNQIDLSSYDYVIDCIDTVSAKLDIIERCKKDNINIICAMGTGNKLDPSKLVLTDISKTEGCPLAKVVRTELRKKGINHLNVCYSLEQSAKIVVDNSNGRHSPASISFVPSSAGLLIASKVVNDIIGE